MKKHQLKISVFQKGNFDGKKILGETKISLTNLNADAQWYILIGNKVRV